jgi:hypothetical protein
MIAIHPGRSCRRGLSLIQCLYANPSGNSRPEIHLPDHVSQERRCRPYPGLVRRKRRQALRNDPQRLGKIQAHTKQPQGSNRALHRARKNYRPRVRSHRAPSPYGRLDLGPRNDQAQVLAHANTVLLEQEKRLCRNRRHTLAGIAVLFSAPFAQSLRTLRLKSSSCVGISCQLSVIRCQGPQFAAFFNSLLPFSFRSTTSTLLRGVFIKFSEAKWQSK